MIKIKAQITFDGEIFVNTLPNFFRNDFGNTLFIQITDNTGSSIDITGLNITFKMKLITSTVNKISSLCTNTTPLEGRCTYTFVLNDLDTGGVYDAELQIEDTGVSIQTISLGRLTVLEDLP